MYGTYIFRLNMYRYDIRMTIFNLENARKNLKRSEATMSVNGAIFISPTVTKPCATSNGRHSYRMKPHHIIIQPQTGWYEYKCVPIVKVSSSFNLIFCYKEKTLTHRNQLIPPPINPSGIWKTTGNLERRLECGCCVHVQYRLTRIAG